MCILRSINAQSPPFMYMVVARASQARVSQCLPVPVDCAYRFALSRSLPEGKALSVVAGEAAPTTLVLACSESSPWMVRARASRSFSIRSYRFTVLQADFFDGVCVGGERHGKDGMVWS
jgi:hypothetical protein